MKKGNHYTKLQTIKHFAHDNKVSTTYIYRLIREEKITMIEIDGVKFVDTSISPTLPTR
jgi:hypothetical protein